MSKLHSKRLDDKLRQLIQTAGPVEILQLRKMLEEAQGELVMRSFKLPKSLSDQFNAACKRKGVTIQDGAIQAISNWVSEND